MKAIWMAKLLQLSVPQVRAVAATLCMDISTVFDKCHVVALICHALSHSSRHLQEKPWQSPNSTAYIGTQCNTPCRGKQPPASQRNLQESDFKPRDRALRRGEQCVILNIDENFEFCSVQMMDGRVIDTVLSDLRPSYMAYPNEVHDDSCPICLRPACGDCVPCCNQCEASRWLHRSCLFGLVCSVACPSGHSLRESRESNSSTSGPLCSGCEQMSGSKDIIWRCEDCDWSLCRACIQQFVKPSVKCPTCRTAILTPDEKKSLVLDASGRHHPSCKDNTELLDALFSRKLHM